MIVAQKRRLDGRGADRHPADQLRGRGPAAHARLGAVHPRRDPGAGGDHPRHVLRRAEDRRADRRALQQVHAALQFPAVQRRRGEVPARPGPARDRPRRAGRARPVARCCRTRRSFRTRSGWSPRSSSRTAPRRWPRCAAAASSLMDAGVPIKAPVAGIAMGLIKEGDEVAVLSDILGDEDHLGDMDFKVAGTAEGVTALQMDIKIHGVTKEIMRRPCTRRARARLHILEVMNRTLHRAAQARSRRTRRASSRSRSDPSKIRDIIGPGGKMIRGIIEETGCQDRHRGRRHGLHRLERGDRRCGAPSRSSKASPMEAQVGKIYKGNGAPHRRLRRLRRDHARHRWAAAHLADRPRPRASRLRRAERGRRDPGQGAGDRPLGQDPAEPQGGARSEAARARRPAADRAR